MNRSLTVCGLVWWFGVLAVSHAPTLRAQVPPMLSYQGRLIVGNTNYDGVAEFKLALVNGAGTTTYWSNDGSSAGGNPPSAAVPLPVSKGLYSVLLGDAALPNMTPVPASVFAQPDVRLRVWVKEEGDEFAHLAPDQRLVPVGYAFMAAAVADGSVTPEKLAAGAVGPAALAAGSVGSAQLATDPASLARVSGGWVTVSGGNLNVSGSLNVAASVNAGTLHGSLRVPGNNLTGTGATISGGTANLAAGAFSAVGGGTQNSASGTASAVGGGQSNQATDTGAVVPGGADNTAGGAYAFAAGRRAKAIHDGAFVWADAADEDFASTGGGQFLIRAQGGVGINTASPATALHVDGTVTATQFAGDGALLTGIHATSVAEGTVTSAQLASDAASMAKVSGGSLSVSGGSLTVSRNVSAEAFNGRLVVPRNTLLGNQAAIGGGTSNLTGADYATIAGGDQNVATGFGSTVAGGDRNQASGGSATVGGGQLNVASASYAVTGGGFRNAATNAYATVGGGQFNTASGALAFVGGGGSNAATGGHATISGGADNVASGVNASIPGGAQNVAAGAHSFAAGRRAQAVHDGAFVWADGTAEAFASGTDNEFAVRAAGGVRFGEGRVRYGLTITVTSGTFAGAIYYGSFYVKTNGLTGTGTEVLPAAVQQLEFNAYGGRYGPTDGGSAVFVEGVLDRIQLVNGAPSPGDGGANRNFGFNAGFSPQNVPESLRDGRWWGYLDPATFIDGFGPYTLTRADRGLSWQLANGLRLNDGPVLLHGTALSTDYLRIDMPATGPGVGDPQAIRILNRSAPAPSGQAILTSGNDGFFYIANVGPTNNQGRARLDSTGVWSQVSDAREKRDVAPLDGLLDKALRLRPVSFFFNWQDLDRFPDKRIGLIAQEVEPLFPSLVVTGDGKTLDYATLSVVALGALQEFKQQHDAEIAALKEANTALETRLTAVEAQLEQLLDRLAEHESEKGDTLAARLRPVRPAP